MAMIKFQAKRLPLYMQVKEYIKQNIENDKWSVGFRLPSERDLAEELQVSRKTVSLAYKELEKEGWLSSHQGRGTFVINKPIVSSINNNEDLIKSIDSIIEKFINMGLDLSAFLQLCKERASFYLKELNNVKLIFIECNKEQLDYFSSELELGAGVSITPILLQDFKRNVKEINKKIQDYDLVVTTMFHLDEVKLLIENKGVEVLPIALSPQLESIIKIARIHKNHNVGILCISQAFGEKVKKAISEAGLSFKNIIISTSYKTEEIKKFERNCDAIITSPGRKKDILPYIENGKEIIEFIFVPDMGSINLLKTTILKKHDFKKMG